MKNQITILFAGGLLAANAVMAAPATAHIGGTFIAAVGNRASSYIAISIDPQDAQAYFDRGNAKYGLGDKKGAIADYDSAIRINPQYAEVYSNRGVVKSDLGDKKGAIADYDSAIRLNPGSSRDTCKIVPLRLKALLCLAFKITPKQFSPLLAEDRPESREYKSSSYPANHAP
jgi:tetratricopeptide (TPR) repeat protein